MKQLLILSLLLGSIGFVGCEQTPADRKANDVRQGTQNDADRMRDAADVAADKERAKSGTDPLGNAKNPATESKADAIENEGERRADAIEEGGERKADAIEESDNR